MNSAEEGGQRSESSTTGFGTAAATIPWHSCCVGWGILFTFNFGGPPQDHTSDFTAGRRRLCGEGTHKASEGSGGAEHRPAPGPNDPQRGGEGGQPFVFAFASTSHPVCQPHREAARSSSPQAGAISPPGRPGAPARPRPWGGDKMAARGWGGGAPPPWGRASALPIAASSSSSIISSSSFPAVLSGSSSRAEGPQRRGGALGRGLCCSCTLWKAVGLGCVWRGSAPPSFLLLLLPQAQPHYPFSPPPRKSPELLRARPRGRCPPHWGDLHHGCWGAASGPPGTKRGCGHPGGCSSSRALPWGRLCQTGGAPPFCACPQVALASP